MAKQHNEQGKVNAQKLKYGYQRKTSNKNILKMIIKIIVSGW